MSSDQLRAEPHDAYARPAARAMVEIALVCALVAVLTAGTALWSLTSALAPSRADVSAMVSQRLDGPGPLRHELAREDGPVVQTLTDSIEANQQTYIDSRRSAVARACGLTALVGAVLAALAGWFGASRARGAAASVRPDVQRSTRARGDRPTKGPGVVPGAQRLGRGLRAGRRRNSI